MSTFRDWKAVKKLSGRGETNSEVDLLQKKDSDEFIVRKIIYGIDHPLYQAIFTREMRALYKLNKCENIVSIVGDDYLKNTKTNEKVGVIYLEYINGMELGQVSIEELSSKDRFSIVNQLLNAIEISHSNGIIHRDINPNNIMIEDDLKLFYYRGLKEWDNEKGYLTDTCLTAKDRYQAYLDYFRIDVT